MCFQNPGHTSSEYFTISLLEKSAAWENSSKHWSNFVLISEFPELRIKLLKRVLPIQMTVGTSKRWLIVPSKPRLKKFQKTLPCVVGVAIAQGHFGSSEGPREKSVKSRLRLHFRGCWLVGESRVCWCDWCTSECRRGAAQRPTDPQRNSSL